MHRKRFIIIAFGSNLGDRQKNISHAMKKILSHKGFRLLKSSPLIETEAVLLEEDKDREEWKLPFLNSAALFEVHTSITPYAILDILKKIERVAGRKAGYVPYSPRVIDLDIIYDSAHIIHNYRLTIPHPLAQERDFVSIPIEMMLN